MDSLPGDAEALLKPGAETSTRTFLAEPTHPPRQPDDPLMPAEVEGRSATFAVALRMGDVAPDHANAPICTPVMGRGRDSGSLCQT